MAATGASTSKASTRQRFLIGSAPAARSAACRRRRRRPSRSVQRTVCGLSAPAFSLTDVATTITVSVRDADSRQFGLLRRRRRAARAGLSRGGSTRPPPSRSGRWCAPAASAPACGRARRSASKSALSWPTVPSCSWCRLASTVSLFMLISTLVQSAAACMHAGPVAQFVDVAAVLRPDQRAEHDRGDREHAEHRRADAVAGEDATVAVSRGRQWARRA